MSCWIPGHVDVKGNKEPDKLATEALDLNPSDTKQPFSDFKPVFS